MCLALVLLPACGSDTTERDDARSQASTTTTPTTPRGQLPEEQLPDGLAEAVRQYNAFHFSGRSDDSWQYISTACKQVLDRSAFDYAARVAHERWPNAEVSHVEAHINGTQWLMDVSFVDEKLDQRSEPWVNEQGNWKRDIC